MKGKIYMDNLQWLEKWYFSKCDGDWEHFNGIHITTLDNPGWKIVINLSDTGLENKNFENMKIENNENDRIHCSKENMFFKGACGPLNLNELLNIFRTWVDKI